MAKTINCLWDYGFVLEYSEAIRNLFRPAYISGLLEIHPSSDSKSDKKKIYIYISISSVRLIGVNCTHQGSDSHIYRKHIAL